MPILAITVSDEVARALARQVRALLLSRNVYVRAVLAAVAAQAQAGQRSAKKVSGDA